MKKWTMLVSVVATATLLFCVWPSVFAQNSRKNTVKNMNKNNIWETQPYRAVRLNTETGKALSNSSWEPYVRDEVDAEKAGPTVRWQEDEGDYLLQDNFTAEFQYAKEGNLVMFKHCLKVNKRLDVVDMHYMSLLSAAVWGGPGGNSRPMIVKHLIEKVKMASMTKTSKYLQQDLRRYVNFPDKQGRTPLWYAVMRGNEEVVKTLLDSGAEVEWKKIPDDIKKHLPADIKKGGAPSSVLTEAVGRNNYEIVKLLVERRKPSALELDPAGQNALTTAVLGKNKDILIYLLDSADACPNKKQCLESTVDQDTLLMLAVQKGNQEILNAILARNPSNVLAESKGVNVLQMATEKGDLDALAALVDACRKLHSNDICLNTKAKLDGKTLYQKATAKNQMRVANWLQQQGGNKMADGSSQSRI